MRNKLEKEHSGIMSEIPLFKGLPPNVLRRTLDAMNARREKVRKGAVLFREGERATRFCLIISGSFHLERYSVDGRAELVERVGAGAPIGAAFVCAGESEYRVNAVAVEDSEVLMISASRFLAPTDGESSVHATILARLLRMMAQKNLQFQEKVFCLSQPTTSEKVLAFLRIAQRKAGTKVFEIPFTRQELADYLNVARAALSVEIGKLVRAGIIETDHKAFRFKRQRGENEAPGGNLAACHSASGGGSREGANAG